MSFKHHDEARADAVAALIQWLRGHAESRVVLIDDLYGKYRLILWLGKHAGAEEAGSVKAALAEATGSYWSDEIWVVTAETSKVDQQVYDGAWEEGKAHPDEPRLRIVDRVRNRVAWFGELCEPPWKPERAAGSNQPPIVVFYSFKGGVGRTTCLASFALRRALAGERVAVVDGDLDAPGIGNLLCPDGSGAGARWGVADYLLERPAPGAVDLGDYYHALRRETVAAKGGEILVFPAGTVNGAYLGKLARVDFDPTDAGLPLPWPEFLNHIRGELKPHWILLDSRAGLGEPAGLLVSGVAHLHVLFGTGSEQSWQGLELVLERLGGDRVRAGKPQAGCLLVQAMLPETISVAQVAKEQFNARAEDEFEDHYYAEDPDGDGDDSMWYVRDSSGKDAPHRAVPISYRQSLAHFERLDDIVPVLMGEEYELLERRIFERFLEDAE
jgi:hypothetical protein